MSEPTLDLEAMEARAAAATPGPWTPCPERLYIFGADEHMVCELRGAGAENAGQRPVGSADHNADFIAASRQDVPALVEALRHERAYAEALRQLHEADARSLKAIGAQLEALAAENMMLHTDRGWFEAREHLISRWRRGDHYHEFEAWEREHPRPVHPRSCTCGSGMHPRACKAHPDGMKLHALELSYEGLKDEFDALEKQNTELQAKLESKRCANCGFSCATVDENAKENDRLRAVIARLEAEKTQLDRAALLRTTAALGKALEAAESRITAQAVTLETLKQQAELRAAMLLMAASEMAGDRKLDPDDTSDPRWTPVLKLAAERNKERAELQEIALRVKLGQLEVWPDASQTHVGKALRDALNEVERLQRALRHIADTCVQDPETAQFASRAADGTAEAP